MAQRVPRSPERSLLVEFLRRFRNPLVLILIAASVISALTGEMASFLIIIVMVLMSVILDFVQEYRAGQAAQRLRQSVQIRASVVRDGDHQGSARSAGRARRRGARSPPAASCPRTVACSKRAICSSTRRC